MGQYSLEQEAMTEEQMDAIIDSGLSLDEFLGA